MSQPGNQADLYLLRLQECPVCALPMDTLSPVAKRTRNRAILLLALSAVGTVLFICAAAVTFYRNTHELVAARSLTEHLEEVVRQLETVSARLERLDYLTHNYLAEKNEGDRKTVQTTEAVVDSELSQLQKFIRDNNQRDQARGAHACVTELNRQLNLLMASSQTTVVEGANLTRKILECRDLIGRMEEDEGVLLIERAATADHNAHRNLIVGVVFLAVSLLGVLGLFGILLRDVWRQAETEDRVSHTNEQLKETVEQLKDQAAEIGLIISMREELQLCTTLEEAHRATVRCVAKALPKAKVAIAKVDSTRKMMEIAATSDDQTHILNEFPVSACCGLRVGRPRRRKAGASEIECGHFLGKPPEDYLCMPLVAHGETLGLLYIASPDAESSKDLDLHYRLMERASEVASVWTASLNLRLQLEEQSIHDGLTNLYNRRFMEIALERELLLAIRRKTDLSVLMMDVDHFKRFNDTFGHGAADQALRGVAEVLRQGARAEDIACRYGGDELLLILPGTVAEVARERAEEIRRRVSEMQLDIAGSGSMNVTVSIGVATFPQFGHTPEELVRSADRALYVAKSSGRNRVEPAEAVLAIYRSVNP